MIQEWTHFQTLLAILESSGEHFVFCRRWCIAGYRWCASASLLLSCYFVLYLMPSSINGCLPLDVVFHQKLASIRGNHCVPSMIVFFGRCLPWKIVYQITSSIAGCLPSFSFSSLAEKFVGGGSRDYTGRFQRLYGWVPSDYYV